MKNKIILFAGLALLLVLAGGYGISAIKSNSQSQGSFGNDVGSNNKTGNSPMGNKGEPNRGNCLSDDCLLVENLEYPVGDLPQEVQDALIEAINDEYKALATYEAVISEFGNVRPFSMIKGAEEQHIASLKAVFDKYGMEIPENAWLGKVSAPETLQDACQTGVDAEIANATLYDDELLPAVKEYEDITAVFTNLMNASQDKHLPAFDRCN